MNGTTRTALILGATGGIGGETAQALARHGWNIRALSRNGRLRDSPSSWEWVKGDALDQQSVLAAAKGTDAIVHAVNPPGYRNWATLVLPMIEKTIAAARATGARILLPGTIYNYGPDAFPVLHEDSPQRATTRKGRIRISLEQKLESAAPEGVRTLILRFGDFFGPKAGNNWFSQGMVKPGHPVTSITYPGSKGIGHAWTYLPDAGETFARLMDRESELANFERFHFRGHWDSDGTEMIAAVRKAVGKESIPVRTLPWWIFQIASPFNETLRELYATRPLWRTPIQLDNSKLAQFLGGEPHTPLQTAVEATLRGMGSLR
ncbi:MAG: NAD(P)H-binding protein [Acidobacteriaceae bacterium]|nr:NAD(P)H-binding protein [Acidobacteriaceae bacterium]